jgi:hypothetical protein
MKLRTLLFGFASLLFPAALVAQDVIVIEGGMANLGSLESTINGDVDGTGARNNPNRIYELHRGTTYVMVAGIECDNPGGTLTIRAEAGDGPKPIIIRYPLNEVDVTGNVIVGSLTIQNVYYQLKQTNGAFAGYWEGHWRLSENGSRLVVEDCVFEFMDGILFNTDGIKNGQTVIIRNNYFRDYHDGGQWWAGRVLNCKVPIDSLIYEGNTSTGAGLTVLGQETMTKYGMINHNTFINNTKYPFLNQYWLECYYTNNLFVNANWVGEDHENVATGGQDPDALLHGLVGLDTITTRIWIDAKYYANPADSTGLSSECDEISDYIWYAADNVCVASATLDNYYNGTVDGVFTDAPASYLNWSGLGTGPWKVDNVPGILMNSRALALIADHDNIKAENNSEYVMTAEAMGFGTDPLPQAAADVYIEWNRAQWGVPGISAPDLAPTYFGDYNPQTIPGPGTEDGAGITKVSELIEDFSYTADVTSHIDGLPVGALHWKDIAFDSKTLTAKVKAAYNGTLGIEDRFAPASRFGLTNYPNPFHATTTISFNLQKDSYVNLSVYDISGRLVETLINEHRASGVNTVQFSPDYSANSAYFYKLTTDFGSETRKMLLLK